MSYLSFPYLILDLKLCQVPHFIQQIILNSTLGTNDVAVIVFPFMKRTHAHMHTHPNAGATLYYLGEKAMTVTLVLLTLLLSYLLLFRVSLLFILAMYASVFLLHQVMGPKWIFDWLFHCGYQSSKVLWLMLAHYYISSVVIVLLFAYTILFPLARRFTQRRPEQQLNDLERTVLDISKRLTEMERKQTEVLAEIGQRQLEIISILRRLDPNQEKN